MSMLEWHAGSWDINKPVSEKDKTLCRSTMELLPPYIYRCQSNYIRLHQWTYNYSHCL